MIWFGLCLMICLFLRLLPAAAMLLWADATLKVFPINIVRFLDARILCLVTIPEYDASPAHLVSSLDEALDLADDAGESECFVIGGGQVYKMALDAGVIDTMYITHVHGAPEGDAFFPEFDSDDWTMQVIDNHPEDDRHEFSFTICKYDRKE